jgi:uncharacterized protein involved in exopolysaccharide biosynthesis
VNRYFGVFRKHKLLVSLPLIITLICALGYEFKQPRQYVSTATLWADSPVPNDSTILSAPNPAPASAEAGVLSELLQTHQFLDSVLKRDPSAEFLVGHVKDISLETPGPQVLSVSVTSKSPALASNANQAVIDEFLAEVKSNTGLRGLALQNYYKQQLDTASNALATAQEELGQYLRAHPASSGSTNDPVATQLAGTVAAAQQQYATARSNYDSAGLGLSTGASLSELHVIDKPQIPTAPKSMKKKLLFAGVGGLLGGLVLSLSLLAILVTIRPAPLAPSDIEETLGLRVVGTVTEMPSSRRSRREVS